MHALYKLLECQARSYATYVHSSPQLTRRCTCRSAGPFSVENWLLEFPTATQGLDFPPFILWPWKWSDFGPIGYLKLPALPFEYINGLWFLYNPTAPGEPTFQLLPFAQTANETRRSGMASAEGSTDASTFGMSDVTHQIATAAKAAGVPTAWAPSDIVSEYGNSAATLAAQFDPTNTAGLLLNAAYEAASGTIPPAIEAIAGTAQPVTPQ